MWSYWYRKEKRGNSQEALNSTEGVDAGSAFDRLRARGWPAWPKLRCGSTIADTDTAAAAAPRATTVNIIIRNCNNVPLQIFSTSPLVYLSLLLLYHSCADAPLFATKSAKASLPHPGTTELHVTSLSPAFSLSQSIMVWLNDQQSE